MSAAGDEKALGWELLDALAGRPPRSDAWRKGDGPPANALGVGSNNIPLLRKAVQLLREGARWATWWIEWFHLSEQTWMGRELLSRIYRGWHLIAVIVVRQWAVDHGRPDLLHAADRWLACWWAAIRGIRAPDGVLAPVGWRANDHPGPDGQLEADSPDLATEIALYYGEHAATLAEIGQRIAADCDALLRDATHEAIQADRQRWSRPVEAATRRILATAPAQLRTLLERCDRAAWATWERIVIYRLVSTIRQTAMAARNAPSDEAALDTWTPGIRTLFPVEIGFGPGYRVVLIARNANSNTPPILAAWWQAGDWRTLPPESILRHIRQTADHSTATRSGREITVTSTIYDGGPWSHTVPAGTRFRTLDRPAGAEPPVEPPQPPTEPEAPQPPAPPPPGEPRRRDRDSARIVLVCIGGAALVALLGHLRGCW